MNVKDVAGTQRKEGQTASEKNRNWLSAVSNQQLALIHMADLKF
jgi:hypothetical protein